MERTPEPCPRPANTSKAYHLLSRSLTFPNYDQHQWWQRTGPMMGKMLADARYSPEEQCQYLCLYALHIMPFLGRFPTASTPDLYKGVMGGLGALEPAMNFTQNGSEVRIDWEPTGYMAGTGMDHYNRLALDESVQRLRQLNPRVDPYLYRELVEELTLTDPEVQLASAQPGLDSQVSRTQSLLALDLKDESFVLKLYFLPRLKSMVTGVSMSDLMARFVRKVDSQGLYQESLVALEAFLHQSPLSTSLYLFSCDLVEPTETRFKIYVLETEVNFRSIARHWTLGGRLQDPETMEGLGLLRDLWELLNIPDGAIVQPDRPPNPDDPPARVPVGFNYELRPGERFPQPKIYIPVSGLNDRAVAEAISEFFARIGWVDHAREYMGNLESYLATMRPGEDLSNTDDFQFWLSFAYSGKKGVYMTVYFH